MSKEILIRQGNIFDIDEIIHISELYLKETLFNDVSISDVTRFIRDNFNYKVIENNLNRENTYYYVLQLNNRIVGYFKLNDLENKTIDMQNDYLQLEYLFILSEYQDEQLYTIIFNKIENFAKNLKKDYFYTNINENKKYLLKIYTDNNFETFDKCITFIGSKKINNVLVRKKIKY